MSSLKMKTVQLGDIGNEIVNVISGISHQRFDQGVMDKAIELGWDGVLLLIKSHYTWNPCDLYEILFSGGRSQIVPCALSGQKITHSQVYSLEGKRLVIGTKLFCRHCETRCTTSLRCAQGVGELVEVFHPEPGALLKYNSLSQENAELVLSWFDIIKRTAEGNIDYGYDCKLVVIKKPEPGQIRKLRIGTLGSTYIISYDGENVSVEQLDVSTNRFLWDKSQPYPTPDFDVRTGEPLQRRE